MITQIPQTPIDSMDFIAFDTETTGFSPKFDAIVEIAAVRFRLNQGPLEYFQTLVHPGRLIPKIATHIHGIDGTMVANAPKIYQVLPAFYRFIEGAVPMGHNVRFDLGFLHFQNEQTPLPVQQSPVLDTYTMARRVWKTEPSYKLEKLATTNGITVKGAHRAMADTKVCMELFLKLIKDSVGRDASWEELVEAHGKTKMLCKVSQ